MTVSDGELCFRPTIYFEIHITIHGHVRDDERHNVVISADRFAASLRSRTTLAFPEKKLPHVLSSGKLHYGVAVTLYYSENYLPRGRHPESSLLQFHTTLARSDMIKFLLSRKKYSRAVIRKPISPDGSGNLLLEERSFDVRAVYVEYEFVFRDCSRETLFGKFAVIRITWTFAIERTN